MANNNCSYGNNATNDECSMDIFGRYSGGGVCVGCKVRDRIFNVLEEFYDIHDSIKNVNSSLRICKYQPRMIKLCD